MKINHGLAFMTDGLTAAGKPATTGVTIPKQPRLKKPKSGGGHPPAEKNRGR